MNVSQLGEKLGCLCKPCFDKLVVIAAKQNDEPDAKLNLDKAGVYHLVPHIAVPYTIGDYESVFWSSVSAKANYCCECGVKL